MKPSDIVESSLTSVLKFLDTSKFRDKQIFLTGGTGFFGLWLLTALKLIHAKEPGLKVTALSRNPDKFLGQNPPWADEPWLRFVAGDVKSFSMGEARFDYLIHAATDTSAHAHVDPIAIFDDVAQGSRNVMEFAVRAGIKRALLTSSGAVYGAQPAGIERISEDDSIACKTHLTSSAYGEGKRVMEFLASAFHNNYGIESAVARCFAFVGPGLPLDQHFAIGNFIRDALHKDEIQIKGDGSAVRSYLYGADLAVWLLKILVEGAPTRIYNVGSDQYLTMRQLAQVVVDVLAPGKTIRVESQAAADNAQRSVYVPSIERAKKDLGLAVWTPLEKAIKLAADYHRATETQ